MNNTRKVGRGESHAAKGGRGGGLASSVRGESAGEAVCQKERGGCQNEPEEEGIFSEIFLEMQKSRQRVLGRGASVWDRWSRSFNGM